MFSACWPSTLPLDQCPALVLKNCFKKTFVKVIDSKMLIREIISEKNSNMTQKPVVKIKTYDQMAQKLAINNYESQLYTRLCLYLIIHQVYVVNKTL